MLNQQRLNPVEYEIDAIDQEIVELLAAGYERRISGPRGGSRLASGSPRPPAVQRSARAQVIATGSTMEPVAPRIASGSATNRNSRTPAAAIFSRSRLSSR